MFETLPLTHLFPMQPFSTRKLSKLYLAFFFTKKTHYQMPKISKLLYKLMLYKLRKNHLQVNGTQNKGQQKKY